MIALFDTIFNYSSAAITFVAHWVECMRQCTSTSVKRVWVRMASSYKSNADVSIIWTSFNKFQVCYIHPFGQSDVDCSSNSTLAQPSCIGRVVYDLEGQFLKVEKLKLESTRGTLVSGNIYSTPGKSAFVKFNPESFWSYHYADRLSCINVCIIIIIIIIKVETIVLLKLKWIRGALASGNIYSTPGKSVFMKFSPESVWK